MSAMSDLQKSAQLDGPLAASPEGLGATAAGAGEGSQPPGPAGGLRCQGCGDREVSRPGWRTLPGRFCEICLDLHFRVPLGEDVCGVCKSLGIGAPC